MGTVAIRHILVYFALVKTLPEQLMSAIERSGQTRYAISKGSGVNPSQLSRFMSGERSLSFESAEKVAGYLQLEIVLRPKRRAANRQTGKAK